MSTPNPHEFLALLINQYKERRESIKPEELDILCMYNDEVKEIVSKEWAIRLDVDSCIYNGKYLEITGIDNPEKATVVKITLENLGFPNARIYYCQSSPGKMTIEGRKEQWFSTPGKLSQKLHQQICSSTGVSPIYVSCFAGETIVDVNSEDDVPAVQRFLENRYKHGKQEVLIGKDERLSLEITRLRVIDPLTPRYIQA